MVKVSKKHLNISLDYFMISFCNMDQLEPFSIFFRNKALYALYKCITNITNILSLEKLDFHCH